MTGDEREVWNRACDFSIKPISGLREADKALGALLHAHGLICNGGVYHGVEECLSPEQLKAACAGYRYFSLDDAAELLEEAGQEEWNEENEKYFNHLYYTRFLDKVIMAKFTEHFLNHRNLYAP